MATNKSINKLLLAIVLTPILFWLDDIVQYNIFHKTWYEFYSKIPITGEARLAYDSLPVRNWGEYWLTWLICLAVAAIASHYLIERFNTKKS